MSDILETTELGMLNDVQRMNTISNNLANTGTAGFKRQIPVSRSFETTLGQALSGSADSNTDLAGSAAGVKNVIDPSTGPFKYTGNKFDVAIEGEGFFEVTTANGVFYTRQGAFSLDSSGRLITTGGYPVNGLNGDIRIGSGEPRIDKQGRIWENEKQIGQIKVVNFSNPRNLQKIGSGLYSAGANNKEALLDSAKIRIRQGYLESSNVVMMNEMVQMIETMRHFETSQRLIKGYDDLLDTTIRTLGDY